MSTITPINRWTEKEGNVYRVYSKSNPHYYKDKTGSYHSIDITNLQTLTKDTVGQIKLREKNIVSAGLRTDGNKTKYLGLRPDNTQEDGTHQLEWTIEEAVINNSNQSITLNQTNAINNTTTNLGGQVVQSTRNYTRQMVPVSGTISNFQVKYKLHLTGLQISNSKYTQNTTIRNNISGSGTITAGTSHYVSDEHGRFIVTDSDNKTQFMIKLPLLLDSNLRTVTSDTTHTLKDNGDGTYEYIKYPSDNLLSEGISDTVAYIDATTVYAETDLDGSVTRSQAYSMSWNTAHDFSSGNATDTDGDDHDAVYAKFVAWLGGAPTITRAFFGFDTSGISTTPTAAAFKVKTKTNSAADAICLQATHTGISGDTFNDFSGWESGWDGEDTSGIIEYSGEIDPATNGNFTEITLNATALTAIGNNDTTKICGLDHQYDYQNNVPSNISVGWGLYFTENTGTDKDPYLYITEAPTTEHKINILGGKTSILGGNFVIK